jgi:DNA-binding MarR family transcriptional regulator
LCGGYHGLYVILVSVSKRIIEIEGQRGILQIMMVLHRNGELLYGKLYNNRPFIEISNNSTAKRALTILLRNGLINEREREQGNAKLYCLTDKGRRFAGLINQIEELLEEI